jgi:beta-phosphoglucomutase family hydrolase
MACGLSEVGNRKVGTVLGLPNQITACLFDLDGVLTKTALIHAQAWKQTFDAFLRERAQNSSEEYVPFDKGKDYLAYVDGRERTEGVSQFLASRGITLPVGQDSDSDFATQQGLGRKKTELFDRLLNERGVTTYPSSVEYLRALHQRGIACAVVSASKHARQVVAAGGLEDFFLVRVDGVTAAEQDLRGKPAPDMFLEAAALLAKQPDECAVFEDAIAGVQAGHAAEAGYVVGVDRNSQPDALRDAGADVVVSDLAELLVQQ